MSHMQSLSVCEESQFKWVLQQ